MSAVAAYVSAFAPVAGEPDWWLAQRRAAITAFERAGFPSAQDELWRLTDLKPLTAQAFLPPQAVDGAKAAAMVGEAASLLPGAWRFVLVDGGFAPALSDLAGLPEGITLAPTHSRPRAVEPLTALLPDGIAALGVAFARDGLVLRIPAGLVLERPIHLISVQTEAGRGTHTLSRIDLEGGAQAEVIETYMGGAGAWLNAAAHVSLAIGSHLTHGIFVRSEAGAQVFARVSAHVEKAARYSASPVLVGAQQSRVDLVIDLAEDHAEADVKGLYLLSGNQRGQVLTEIHHDGHATRTNELFKGVADDHAHGVFQGKIAVTERGQKTDAQMQSRVLLLSETARADTKPELEIYADDVKCSHGATVGDIDANALFYLMARGLSRAEARRLLLRAFLEEVADGIDAPATQAAVRALLGRALDTPAQEVAA